MEEKVDNMPIIREDSSEIKEEIKKEYVIEDIPIFDVDMDNLEITISGPETVNQGFMTSYKLYKIESFNKKDGSKIKKVERRFKDFVWLYEILCENRGGCVIPSLPEKNFLSKFDFESAEFQAKRKQKLKSFLEKLIIHSKLRESLEVKTFIFEDENEFGKITQSNEFSYSKIIGNLMVIKESISTTLTGQSIPLNNIKDNMAHGYQELYQLANYFLELEILVLKLSKLMNARSEMTSKDIKANVNISKALESSNSETESAKEHKEMSNKFSFSSEILSESLVILKEKILKEISKWIDLIIEMKNALIRFDTLQSSVKEINDKIHQHKYKNLNSSKRDSTLDDFETKFAKCSNISQKNLSDLLEDLRFYKSCSEKFVVEILKEFKDYEMKLNGRVY